MLDYGPKPPMKGECLLVPRLLGLEIGQNPIAKVIRFDVLLCIAILTTIQTYLFLQRFEAEYFMRYSPLYAASFFLGFQVIAYPILYQLTIEALRDFKLWDITSAGDDIKKRIKKESLYFNTVLVLTFLCCFISAVVHIIPGEEDKEIFYVLAIFDEYLSDTWNIAFSWSCRLTYFLMVFLVLSPCCIVMYLFLHFKFQMYMLIHHLEKIDDGTTEESVYDEEYQREVRHKLVYCFKRRTLLFTTANRAIEKASTLMVLFIGTAVLLGIIFVFFYFSGTIKNKNMKIASLVLAGVLAWFHTIWCGQDFEDSAVKELETLTKLKWYYWNKENKQIYLIYLTSLSDTFKATILLDSAINFELGVSMGKSIYSMVSVLSQLNIDY